MHNLCAVFCDRRLIKAQKINDFYLAFADDLFLPNGRYVTPPPSRPRYNNPDNYQQNNIVQNAPPPPPPFNPQQPQYDQHQQQCQQQRQIQKYQQLLYQQQLQQQKFNGDHQPKTFSKNNNDLGYLVEIVPKFYKLAQHPNDVFSANYYAKQKKWNVIAYKDKYNNVPYYVVSHISYGMKGGGWRRVGS